MKRGQFIEHLRTALMQFDDLQALRQSPLLTLCNQVGLATNPVHFQQLLFEGIEGIKEIDSPRAEHMYEILYYRYVEQGTQTDVAYQMGVSVRQLRREQNSAIELLADLLWDRVHLAVAQDPQVDPSPQHQVDDGVQAEISWLHEFQAEASNFQEEFERALENALLIAERYGVQVAATVPPHLPPVAVPPMALRQALLTALTALISTASPNTLVRIAIDRPVQTSLRVTLRQEGDTPARDAAQMDRAMIHTISRLLAPFDAHIEFVETDATAITLLLPGIETIPVLVVDDNPDVRQLLQRYAANTRLRVIATDDSERAISLVSESGIQAIVMDIMMPGDDGWDLLGRLRHHPTTADIPIAVCTILPQRELSLLLGATAFIQKPVEQTAFLKLLAQMVSS